MSRLKIKRRNAAIEAEQKKVLSDILVPIEDDIDRMILEDIVVDLQKEALENGTFHEVEAKEVVEEAEEDTEEETEEEISKKRVKKK